MKKGILSVLIPVLILSLIFAFGSEDKIPAEELIENEIAIVNIDELYEEVPDLEMQMNPFPIIQEAAEQVKENKGYDLIFSNDVLLASSDEIADNITDQVAEEIDKEIDGDLEEDDFFDENIDDDFEDDDSSGI